MPESKEKKESTSAGQGPGKTDFGRFKSLASLLVRVPKEEVDGNKVAPQKAPKKNAGR